MKKIGPPLNFSGNAVSGVTFSNTAKGMILLAEPQSLNSTGHILKNRTKKMAVFNFTNRNSVKIAHSEPFVVNFFFILAAMYRYNCILACTSTIQRTVLDLHLSYYWNIESDLPEDIPI
ncbi:hypothetical protein HS088_TW11G00262 [Tripterygium wilfordii]|uniref:Uncharacterized protein n=1 Tax=Tripterygium wilfordii TaxID=458696 RepID=A0A7J7D296_TRIWF|nr:hypothetical protein HS088_TW11G00262 [Tripterygium wilfordii]